MRTRLHTTASQASMPQTIPSHPHHALDIHKRQWSEELLAVADISKSFANSTKASPSSAALQKRRRKKRPQGRYPCVVGGHDHICGAFAAGVMEPGKVLDSMGTSESLVAAFTMVPDMDMSIMQGFNVGCHVVPGCHYIHGGVDSGGISFEWFREQFEDGADYAYLIQQAQNSQPGAQGMFFVPHLRGGSPSVRDPYSKAGFVGVRDFHTKADFARSIHEGLACELTQIMRTMEDVLGLEFSEIYATGGGTKNPLWMEIKCSVAGKPINIPAIRKQPFSEQRSLAVSALSYGSYREAVLRP